MSRFHCLRPILTACAACVLLLGAAAAHAQASGEVQPNPPPTDYATSEQSPGRVARLAYLSGKVQFAAAGEDDWGSVEVNRPVVMGDRLLTGDDGLAVVELGDASVRIDTDSAFDFLGLTQDNVQIELSEGTLNLAVRQMTEGENFEVDTPTIAFVAATPGIYRIDDNPDGPGSMVTVFQGSGTVYGEQGASRQVVAGTSYRFNDSTLASIDINGLPEPDAFDRFCEARDAQYARYAQAEQRYLPPDMIGGDELYQYGQWDDTPEYGNVWYPNSVPAGWAPYRYGRWVWVGAWGWTWVDRQPWGFAPFHYGRWVHVRNRWGWMPGPVNVRPVYAPALVAFVGGAGFSLSVGIGGGPVGWFPLGPRDIYRPWFHASRRYFTRVNVTNLRHQYVNRTAIKRFYADYRAGRGTPLGRHVYAWRHLPGAVTAVPRKVFVGAGAVHPAALKLDRGRLARLRVAAHPVVVPDAASLGVRRSAAGQAIFRGRKPFARPIITRHRPPPRSVGFAARRRIIARQHGRPLTAAQMRTRRQAPPAAGHRGESARLPRAPVLRAAPDPQRTTSPSGRLPVVPPLERAPRTGPNHAAPRRERIVQFGTESRAQRLQRQRITREQARQRFRTRQMQQRQTGQAMQLQQRERAQAMRLKQRAQQQRVMQSREQQRAMEVQHRQPAPPRTRPIQRAPQARQYHAPPARRRYHAPRAQPRPEGNGHHRIR